MACPDKETGNRMACPDKETGNRMACPDKETRNRMAWPKEEYAGNTTTCLKKEIGNTTTGANNYVDWKHDDIAKQDWNHRIIPKQGDRKYDDLAEQGDWKAPCRARIKILETVTIRYYSDSKTGNGQRRQNNLIDCSNRAVLIMIMRLTFSLRLKE